MSGTVNAAPAQMRPPIVPPARGTRVAAPVPPMMLAQRAAPVAPRPLAGEATGGPVSPLDYSDVPAFLKRDVDLSKVQQVRAQPKTADEQRAEAYVFNDAPYKVNVNMPQYFGKPDLNHELTHVDQFTRSPDIPQPYAPTVGGGHDSYDYGGTAGLHQARNSGKTMASFNQEQQANMVRDYKAAQDKYLEKAAKGVVTKEDEQHMYDAYQAYHPFVAQLAAVPGAGERLQPSMVDEALGRNLPTIPVRPAAPGLPAYDTPGLGVMPADPLLGGRSQAVPLRTSPQAPRPPMRKGNH